MAETQYGVKYKVIDDLKNSLRPDILNEAGNEADLARKFNKRPGEEVTH
jgi:hypothetical protein